MISLNVASLFTQMLIVESLNHLSQNCIEDILALFRHVLTPPYFSVGGQFY
jgi:hypothetical protein